MIKTPLASERTTKGGEVEGISSRLITAILFSELGTVTGFSGCGTG